MKLASIFPTVLVATVSAEFYSPTAEATISSSGSFNFTWRTDHYFEESTLSISVLLLKQNGLPIDGVDLVQDMTPNTNIVGADGILYRAYTVELTPSFFGGDTRTGSYNIVVLERCSPFQASDATHI